MSNTRRDWATTRLVTLDRLICAERYARKRQTPDFLGQCVFTPETLDRKKRDVDDALEIDPRDTNELVLRLTAIKDALNSERLAFQQNNVQRYIDAIWLVDTFFPIRDTSIGMRRSTLVSSNQKES
jgi:hypothetical protein